MQWIIFGDSGEGCPQVYAFIKKKYPKKVKNYYIRNVNSGKIKEYN